MIWDIPHTPIQELSSRLLTEKEIRILIKRDDLTHPEIMGNKWRKLKYNLLEARARSVNTIVTFGGAYSNHIAATAAACHAEGFRSIGIIRGEELHPNANPTLRKASEHGMELRFVDRSTFRTLKEKPQIDGLNIDNSMILPEGGTNAFAVRGCAEIMEEIGIDFDICCVPLGTGGTMMGILSKTTSNQQVWGFSALRGNWLNDHVDHLKSTFSIHNSNYLLFQEDLFGGYGRFNQNLIQFILDFRQEYGILIDPIYTGKMFYRVWDMIKNDQIAKKTTLLMIHTGGLQGIEGFNFRFGLNLPGSEQGVL